MSSTIYIFYPRAYSEYLATKKGINSPSFIFVINTNVVMKFNTKMVKYLES